MLTLRSASSAPPNPNTSALPSGRVLHVRNLPLDATQQELTMLCSAFGRVTQVLLLNTKPQAFVELETPTAAAALLQHFLQTPALLRGRAIYFQYSNRDTVGLGAAAEVPKPILLFTISNLRYPVTVEHLYTVCSPYGVVYKIVLFSKSGAFQALVQFMDPTAASNAKTALDGQNLYVGACSMRVQYSQLPDLTVKYNNDRSRNFFEPTLPTSASLLASAPYTAGYPYHANPNSHALPAHAHPSMHATSQGNGRGPYQQ